MAYLCIVTGASGGFGFLTARALAKAGHIVYAGLWSPDGNTRPFEDLAESFAKENDVDLRTVQLDVISESSINAAVALIMKAPEARLDTLIHNAGHMSFDVAEAFTPKQCFEVYDICCVSTERINRVALPHMRKAGKGLLVWVSSSSAQRTQLTVSGPVFCG